MGLPTARLSPQSKARMRRPARTRHSAASRRGEATMSERLFGPSPAVPGAIDRRGLLRGGAMLAAGLVAPLAALHPAPARANAPETFEPGEVVNSGHRFFGSVSRGLASVVEEA